MSEEKSPNTMVSNDTELILKAQQGDMLAFEQLVYRYDRRVLSIAATYVNSAEDAKDIYQEVFLRVYRGLGKFELRSEFSTWLYRITTNVCLSHRSRRKRHAHSSLDSASEGEEESHGALPFASGVSSDQRAIETELSGHIEEALRTLAPREKLVFTLRHFEGYKLREIAGMLECSEGAVKKYLFTATRKMRKKLKAVYG